MSVEAWISIATALVSIGVFVGLTKSQDKRIDHLDGKVDRLQETCVTKSDFRELAKEVRAPRGPYRSFHEE